MEERGDPPGKEDGHEQDQNGTQHCEDSGCSCHVKGVVELWPQNAVREVDLEWGVILNEDSVRERSQTQHDSSQEHEVGSLADVDDQDCNGQQIEGKPKPREQFLCKK